MKTILILLQLLVTLSIYSQTHEFPGVKIKDDSLEYLKLNKLFIDIVVIENIATTTMKMEYYNNTNRVLEGELNFPLDNGQTVSRFAMDVNGSIREGVVVEKEKGTEVFETIVREKIDPGLLEMTEGNNFRSRVYPIPPNGTKTIIVGYEHQLNSGEDDYIYFLPLEFKDELEKFSVNVEVFNAGKKPLFIKNDFISIPFEKVNNSYSCIFSKENFVPQFNIRFKIPKQSNTSEVCTASGEVNPEDYFYITTRIPQISRKKNKPEQLTIFWDNSSSSIKRDKKKELEILGNYFSWIKNTTIELIIFSNTLDSRTFYEIKEGKWSNLRTRLSELQPDGATGLGELDFSNFDCDEILLFTDGLSNYGNSEIVLSKIPVMVFNSSSIANHSYLQYIAGETKGIYYNLGLKSSKEIVIGLTSEHVKYIKADFSPDEVTELCTGNIPFENQISFTGIVKSETSSIIIHFGYSMDDITHSLVFKINNNNPLPNKLIERVWIQKKINELNVNYEKNKDLITSLGMKYGVVTPSTSLIVLDNTMDYVNYNILPPAELQEEYYSIIENRRKEKESSLQNRLDYVDNLYQEKIDWWKTDWKKVEEKRREKARKDSIAARQKMIDDSLIRIEQKRLDSIRHSETAFRDSLLAIEKARNDSLSNAINTLNNEAVIRARKRQTEINDSILRSSYSLEKKKVSGTVLDAEEMLPLPGVTVFLKGTNHGILTDRNGKFELDLPINGILSFSYVGYKQEEIDVSGLSNIEIAISPEIQLLEEVVVVGYGVQKKSDLTGAISTVEIDDLLMVEVRSAEENMAVPNMYIKPWDPETPYLNKLKKVEVSYFYPTYLDLKNKYNDVPSFYLDVASYAWMINQKTLAKKILSNLAEIKLADHDLLRVLGRKLIEFGEPATAIRTFIKVLEMRPFEPHSYRDLGLAYAENGENQLAIETLYNVITQHWSDHISEKFPEIELIVLGEINSIIKRAGKSVDTDFIDPRLLENLPVDIRIVLNWDSDNTDMDLWVTDPNNEKCYFKNNRTKIGGYMSEDMTEGYGPEEFLLKNAIKGKYKVEVDYYGSSEQTISGPVTIQSLFFTNFGTENETVKEITIRMSGEDEEIHMGDFIY